MEEVSFEKLINVGPYERDRLDNFFVIEGIDGSGISTLAELLKDHFIKIGRAVEKGAEPTKGTFGKHIREILANLGDDSDRTYLAQLFTHDRLDHMMCEVFPAHDRGDIYISERYYYSSIVYQGTDPKCSFSTNDICNMNRVFPVPRAMVYLDAPVDVALERITQRYKDTGKTLDIFETKEHLESVSKMYKKLMQNVEHNPMRLHMPSVHLKIIDASLPIDEVFQIAKDHFEPLWKEIIPIK